MNEKKPRSFIECLSDLTKTDPEAFEKSTVVEAQLAIKLAQLEEKLDLQEKGLIAVIKLLNAAEMELSIMHSKMKTDDDELM